MEPAAFDNDPTPAPTAPERFLNPPNIITLLRIAAVPVVLILPWADGRAASFAIGGLYIAAATTDLIDGWVARRGGQVTKIGKLLDPLADKLLVTAALVVLLAAGRIPLWGAPLVVALIGRELAVNSLRGMVSAQGAPMAAARAGKVKTVFQNISIGALILPSPWLGIPVHTVGLVLLPVATALTLWSGYLYFARYLGGDAQTAPVAGAEQRPGRESPVSPLTRPLP